MVAIFYRKLYETFVEAVDAVDNGIPQYDGTPRYFISPARFGSISIYSCFADTTCPVVFLVA